MSPVGLLPSAVPAHTLPAGSLLLRRGQAASSVTFLEAGRVLLGVLVDEKLEHLLGEIQGPCWLEASASVLDQAAAVDAVAETEVVVRRIPLGRLRQAVAAMPVAAQALLHDVAQAHRQQTQLAVSRVAKDAEARCAEWLLQHAERSAQGHLTVPLQARKRLIAAQLGIAPETLSRVLRHLRERSLISGTGRVLNLLDPGGLQTLAGS